jgi:hypothetical protein
LHLVQVVAGHQDGGAVGGGLADQVADVVDPARVQAVGGLVEHQQPRRLEQRGGQREALAHAQRVPAHPVCGAAGQADPVEHLCHRCVRQAGAAGEQVEDQPAGEVGRKAWRLQHRADTADQLGQARRNGPAEHPDPARVGAQQAEQRAQRGRLARTVLAQQPVDLAGLHAQVQPGQGPASRPAAAAIGLGQSGYLDDGGHDQGR